MMTQKNSKPNKFPFRRLRIPGLVLASLVISTAIVLKNQNIEEVKKLAHFEKLELQDINLDEPTLELSYQGNKVLATTTLSQQLQEFIKKQLRQYKPDYAAVVVLENKTGKILAGVGYSKESNTFDHDLVFSNTHPSASLFKIVTAADLLENTYIEGDSNFQFPGRASTLYRYQLEEQRRYGMRKITLNEAFAKSNNPVFGKAAIRYSNDERLLQMAERFGFNSTIMNDVSIKSSVFRAPTSEYHRAELASGFNKETNISPIHAAVLAQIIANDGEMIRPRIIEEFSDEELNKNLLHQSPPERVIGQHSARELRQMMELTVKKGTARKSFNGFFRGKYKEIEVGGKTGSITGGEPFGKRDWFTGFAYKGAENQENISICVMLINKKKWTIRSSALARRIIEFYFSSLNPKVAINTNT